MIEEHYSQVEPVEIPPELLLQVPLPQQALVEEWLAELRGRKVKIAVPQRLQKADLIDLVCRNAQYELERARRASEQNLLATEDLAQLLELSTPPRRIEGYEIVLVIAFMCLPFALTVIYSIRSTISFVNHF